MVHTSRYLSTPNPSLSSAGWTVLKAPEKSKNRICCKTVSLYLPPLEASIDLHYLCFSPHFLHGLSFFVVVLQQLLLWLSLPCLSFSRRSIWTLLSSSLSQDQKPFPSFSVRVLSQGSSCLNCTGRYSVVHAEVDRTCDAVGQTMSSPCVLQSVSHFVVLKTVHQSHTGLLKQFLHRPFLSVCLFTMRVYPGGRCTRL